MKFNLIILLIILTSCNHLDKKKNSDKATEQTKNIPKEKNTDFKKCNYINDYKNLGNTKIDTIKVGQRIVDPIDDLSNYKKVKFDFVTKGNKIFKKSKTLRQCNENSINVEYYQDFSNRIDLKTYNEFDKTYFTTNGKIYFWWVNSGGYLMLPVDNADPKTFNPFPNICGGTDQKGIYYGCPNKGVNKLNISRNSKYEFIAKKGNYWNSPKHYVIIDKKVFDIKYELKKGYYCEINKSISIADVKKK